MNALRSIANEIAGLFVDDKFLAAGILASVAAAWLAKSSGFGEAAAAVLFFGCIAALLMSALAADRK